MSNTHQQRYWLALLTAILLLMQSFAIWHDAEHAFHTAEEQCERFEAFGHSPTLDVVTSLSFSFTAHTRVVEVVPAKPVLPSRQHETYAIRAPPVFS
jgi:hypothetical protein